MASNPDEEPLEQPDRKGDGPISERPLREDSPSAEKTRRRSPSVWKMLVLPVLLIVSLALAIAGVLYDREVRTQMAIERREAEENAMRRAARPLPPPVQLLPASPSLAHQLRSLLRLPQWNVTPDLHRKGELLGRFACQVGRCRDVETGRSNEKLPKTDAEKQEEIARLQKELRNEYSDAGRYVRMAELHAGLKQQDQSKECLHQAILFYRQRLKTSPSDTSLMRSLGRALVGTGSRLEGMSFLEEAADLLEAGGFLEAMMGNSEQAETDLRLCTSLDPGREKAWMLLAMAVAKISLATRQITPENRETMALVLVQGIAARDTPGLRKHYGRLLFSMDRLDESEQQFGMARKAAPDDLEASLDQAVALIRKEDSPARLPEAQAGLDRAEKILSELEAAGNAGPVESLNESERSQYQACRLIAQGVLDFLAESPEKAAGRFQSALKVDPKNEEAPRALELLKTAVRK